LNNYFFSKPVTLTCSVKRKPVEGKPVEGIVTLTCSVRRKPVEGSLSKGACRRKHVEGSLSKGIVTLTCSVKRKPVEENVILSLSKEACRRKCHPDPVEGSLSKAEASSYKQTKYLLPGDGNVINLHSSFVHLSLMFHSYFICDHSYNTNYSYINNPSSHPKFI